MRGIRFWTKSAMVTLVLVFLTTLGTAWVRAQEHEEAMAEHGAVMAMEVHGTAIFYAIAITMGVACISAGYAVAKVGAAALGAASEKPELMGRALLFVGLAEGIAIYGLIIAVMLVLKL